MKLLLGPNILVSSLALITVTFREEYKWWSYLQCSCFHPPSSRFSKCQIFSAALLSQIPSSYFLFFQ